MKINFTTVNFMLNLLILTALAVLWGEQGRQREELEREAWLWQEGIQARYYYEGKRLGLNQDDAMRYSKMSFQDQEIVKNLLKEREVTLKQQAEAGNQEQGQAA